MPRLYGMGGAHFTKAYRALNSVESGGHIGFREGLCNPIANHLFFGEAPKLAAVHAAPSLVGARLSVVKVKFAMDTEWSILDGPLTAMRAVVWSYWLRMFKGLKDHD